jgi:two-component system response regulator HupR/HoxA
VAAAWPGNVRQLVHEIERAILRCEQGDLEVEHLSPQLRGLAPGSGRLTQCRDQVVEAWELEEIRRGLDRTRWNVTQLALEIGLSRRGLTAKIARYGLRRPNGSEASVPSLRP